MIGAPWSEQIPLLAALAAFYLLPLLVSKRAKTESARAVEITATTAGSVALLMTPLYVLAAGLTGPVTWGGYFSTIAFYIVPSIPILGFWLGALRLASKS